MGRQSPPRSFSLSLFLSLLWWACDTKICKEATFPFWRSFYSNFCSTSSGGVIKESAQITCVIRMLRVRGIDSVRARARIIFPAINNGVLIAERILFFLKDNDYVSGERMMIIMTLMMRTIMRMMLMILVCVKKISSLVVVNT